MKKVLTIFLLLIMISLTALNVSAATLETKLNINSESGTIGSTSVTYDFDGQYLTLNGSWTEEEIGTEQTILTNNSNVIEGNQYHVVLTYISGIQEYTNSASEIRFGDDEYNSTYLTFAYNDVFEFDFTASSTGFLVVFGLPKTAAGYYTDLKIEIELFEVTEVAEEYNVSFISEGSIITEDITSSHLVVKPDDPVRTDFLFGGWYLEETFETKFDFSSEATADISLYAYWIPEVYTGLGVELVTGGATADFSLVQDSYRVYITNSDTNDIDYTTLSTDDTNRSLLSFTENDAYYDTIVISSLNTTVQYISSYPNTATIRLHYDSNISKIVVDHGTGTSYLPISQAMQIYLINSTVFDSESIAVTYDYGDHTNIEYFVAGDNASDVSYSVGTTVLAGWYIDQTFTTEYDFTTVLSTDITLYGKLINSETGEVLNGIEDDTTDETTDDTTDDTTDGSEDEVGEFLQFIEDYWFGMIIILVGVALITGKKR